MSEEASLQGADGDATAARSGAAIPALPAGAAADLGATVGQHEAAAEAASQLWVVPGYEVLGTLGRGGMGVVYKARQTGLKRLVALKMVLAGGHADPGQLGRFRTEAEAVARLQHPGIVQIHEVGEHRGLPYFSMEYCPGGSLAARLGGTPLPAREAAALVEQLAQAVQAAHDKGIIHRDLKPGNVLLAEDGTPKITDFGLAKKLDEAGQTNTGSVLGTPSYMAPEQARGKKDVGLAADVYALGAILYECLTGRPPFKAANSWDTIQQVVLDEPVPPRQLQSKTPRDLETIALKCLAKEPAGRYASAKALAEDLRRFQEGRPIAARSLGRVARGWRWCRRNPLAAALTAAVALSLLAGSGISGYFAVVADRRAGAEAEARQQAEEAQALADARAESESEARRRADANARAEERARKAAERQLAVSKLLFAQSEWRENNIEHARTLLDEVPPEQRRWEWGYLRRLFEGGHLTLYGHTVAVTSVAFRPDGKRLATSGADRTARVWDAETGRELLTLRDIHDKAVSAVAFSPDGRLLATAGYDGTAKVWDAETGRSLCNLRGHRANWKIALAFSPDARRLASAGQEGTIRLWDLQTGRSLLGFRGHGGRFDRIEVSGVAFSPDGKRFATSGWDRTVKVWDAQSGRELLTLTGHERDVFCVAFSPDGTRLASGGMDQTARVWDAATGRELLTIKGHGRELDCVAFSPDGTRLATAGWDRVVKVWDAVTGGELLTLKGHVGQVNAVAFSPDGQRLASAGDSTAKVWDVRDGMEAFTLKGHVGQVSAVAFSPDGRHLATGSHDLSLFGMIRPDRTAKVWDARTGREVLTLRGHQGPVLGVAFSPDGRRLATASGDKTAKVWDIDTGRELLTFQGHREALTGVAFSPDGRHLATAGGNDRTARVWDAQTGRELLVLKGHALKGYGGVNGVAFSPDGRLATAGYDMTVRMWDADSGRELLTLRHPRGVTGVVFSTDGRRLVTRCDDGNWRVWDMGTGQEVLALAGANTSLAISPDGERLATTDLRGQTRVWDAQTGQELLSLKVPGRCVSFSPDGHRLAVAGNDQSVRVFYAGGPEVIALTGAGSILAFRPDGRRLVTAAGQTTTVRDGATGRDLLTLRGHPYGTSTAAFSPDGRRLATGGSGGEGIAKVWDADSGQELHILKHPGAILGVVFSPDGSRLATAGGDGTAKVWDVDSGREVLVLKGHAGAVMGMVFSPDGRRLATTAQLPQDPNRPGQVKVWDAEDGREVATLPERSVVGFSPNGRRLVTRDGRGQTFAWEERSGDRPARQAEVVRQPDPAVGPDGRWRVTSAGGVLYLRDPEGPDADERGFRAGMARFDPLWHDEQVRQAEMAGRWLAAAFHLDRLVQAGPDEPLLRLRRGRARAELGRWQEARDDFARAAELHPEHPAAWRGLALAELALGRPDAYRRTCARFVPRFTSRPEAAVAGLLFGVPRGDVGSALVGTVASASVVAGLNADRLPAIRTALLRQDGLAEPAQLLPLVNSMPLLRGAVLCRAGRHGEAVQVLAPPQVPAPRPNPVPPGRGVFVGGGGPVAPPPPQPGFVGNDVPIALLFLALAEHGRGKSDAARKALDQAERWLATPTPSPTDPKQTNAGRLPFDVRLEAELLRKEAAALLQAGKP